MFATLLESGPSTPEEPEISSSVPEAAATGQAAQMRRPLG